MTAPTPAVAPYVPTYANRRPYLTRAEFMAAPTGVDVSQLIPGSNAAANGAALDTVLMRATSFADRIAKQVLAATVDMQVGRYRVFPDCTIRVPVDNTPLIAVNGASLGARPGALTALADLSGLWIQRKTVWIPAVNVPVASDGKVFAQVLYVNGYANTALDGAVAPGAASIVVDEATGIFAGLQMTIYDDAAGLTEQIVVDPSYVIGSTTVPIVTPLVNAHTDGTAVSALPGAVKQATTCLGAHIIKTRGAEALALSGVSGGPAAIEKEEPGDSEEYSQAVELLKDFRRTW